MIDNGLKQKKIKFSLTLPLRFSCTRPAYFEFLQEYRVPWKQNIMKLWEMQDFCTVLYINTCIVGNTSELMQKYDINGRFTLVIV